MRSACAVSRAPLASRASISVPILVFSKVKQRRVWSGRMRDLHAGTGRCHDGRRRRLLYDHSTGSHPHRDLPMVASHYMSRRPQADWVEGALRRGPVDDQFEVSIGRQGVAAPKRDAGATKVTGPSSAPL
jgi:hypothetical protein